jgi:ATP-dependent RNA helicase DeaD
LLRWLRRGVEKEDGNDASVAYPDISPHLLPRERWFGSIQVSSPVAQALQDLGYQKPTPIQEQAIPPFLEGLDLVGQAMTGTGKTAAFGIPLAELIDPDDLSVQAIVLTPTRELAVQVSVELSRIGAYRRLQVVPIYGGQPIQLQIQALKRGTHVAVGTPGRVMDHLSRGTLHLNYVRFAVLDEADEMLDIGFAEDIDRILRQTPRQRQTALYSATFPSFIHRLIHRHLHDPVWARMGGEIETVDEVAQVYYEIAERDAELGLREILDQQLNGGQALVFCRTQANVDHLVRYLARHHYPVAGLHGSKLQRERDAVMQAFRNGSLKILVSTNLASRGIDIPAITHVINYNMPDNVEEYVHRIGRAGRMGRSGTAITLVREWDFDMLDSIKEYIGNRLLQGKLAASP